MLQFVFFFNDAATTEIYTLSLHDALPISPRAGGPSPRPRRGSAPARRRRPARGRPRRRCRPSGSVGRSPSAAACRAGTSGGRSEEHTSELQSRQYLVRRLLLEKKKEQVGV